MQMEQWRSWMHLLPCSENACEQLELSAMHLCLIDGLAVLFACVEV